MEDNGKIDEYISKMMLDGKLGVHSELVAFSELYNVNIPVFDSLRSGELITRKFN